MKQLFLILAVVGTILAGRMPAQALETPAGPVILTVSGMIGVKNRDAAAAFDLKMLEAMPAVTVVTATPWTEGDTTFVGVALKDLMAAVGAGGKTIHAIALNDYAVDVPMSDADDPQVIIAYRMNGELMKIRDKGPLWLIYPLSAHPELQNQETHGKMIWQIKQLTIN